MRYVFWINLSLAIFFGFMNLIIWVVLLLYWQNLGAPRTSMREFNNTITIELFLLSFSVLTGLVAWGVHKQKRWVWLPEISAVAVMAGLVMYLQSFT